MQGSYTIFNNDEGQGEAETVLNNSLYVGQNDNAKNS